MNTMIILFLVTLNIALAIWNCYAVGSNWLHAYFLGNKFEKLALLSGVIQAGIVFSMFIFAILSLALASVLFCFGYSTETSLKLMESLFDLRYMSIVMPAFGVTTLLLAHSTSAAIQQRDVLNLAMNQRKILDYSRNRLGTPVEGIKWLWREILMDEKMFLCIILFPFLVGIFSGFIIALQLLCYFRDKTYCIPRCPQDSFSSI